jgi:hypothetical protein
MTSEKPRAYPIFLSLILALAAIASTIILPGLFVADPAARSATWDASIIVACALEALIALYAALPFFPKVRESISMAVYPSIAFVLLPYALVAVLTIFLASGRVALYATLLCVETIAAIAVIGILAAVGNTRRGVERTNAVERATVYKPALEARSARDNLSAVKGKGSDAAFKSCADALRRLEERATSATRFGRSGSESAESEIESSIGALAAKVSGLAALAEGDIDAGLGACASEALAIVKALDLRERSLVR